MPSAVPTARNATPPSPAVAATAPLSTASTASTASAPPAASAIAALDAATVRQHLAVAAVRCAVEIVPAIDSTNSELLRRARAGTLPAGPCLLAAEVQQAGRGRLGRAWVAPPGAALTVSFARRFPAGVGALGGLSLVCGLALCDALAAHQVEGRLKWPNDVLVGERKLAGILVEVHADDPGRCTAIIGIGVNTAPLDRPVTGLPPTDMLSARSRQGDADRSATPVDRNRLLADLAIALEHHLTRFGAAGFAPFMSDWNAAHAWRNRLVEVRDGQGTLRTGTARGVDAEGRLCLDTATGPLTVFAGEVSVRSAAGPEAG